MFIQQRVPQQLGSRGSLKWIQRAIEGEPALLGDAIRAAISEETDWTVEWISPRKHDQWAEYRDAGFLVHLDRRDLIPSLKSFWPPGGPQWDALGKGSGGEVILVEAKAHFAELSSDCGAGEKSRVLIDRALSRTKETLGAPASADWSRQYYQYANRLAHMTFLREQGVKAWLVFLYFYGDSDMGGPMTASEWAERLAVVHSHLGYHGDLLAKGVVNVFLPVEPYV